MSTNKPEQIPHATLESFLPLGEKKLPCAVLDNGMRVLSIGAIYKALGRTKRGRGKGDSRVREMPSFADATNLKPYFEKELVGVREQVAYISLKGKSIQGFNAEILPALCKAYMTAAADGVLIGQQKENAKAAASLNNVFSKLGIVAWIDEVTGNQYLRDPAALSTLVSLYIAEEKRKWQKEFRDDFYVQLSRIYGRTMKNPQHRGQWMAKFTTKYIYRPLENGAVLRELEKVNPIISKGYRKDRHHSHASEDYGIIRVRERIEGTYTCLKIATNKRKFDSLYARAFPPAHGYQGDWIDDIDI